MNDLRVHWTGGANAVTDDQSGSSLLSVLRFTGKRLERSPVGCNYRADQNHRDLRHSPTFYFWTRENRCLVVRHISEAIIGLFHTLMFLATVSLVHILSRAAGLAS